MPSVTIETTAIFDEHRKRRLVARITQLVEDHLDDPAQVSVRIRIHDNPVRVLAGAPSPFAKAGLATRQRLGSLPFATRPCRFGRKVEA